MSLKTPEERMTEFVHYHLHGDGECNSVILACWAKKHCRTIQEQYELAFFFAVTYCVESAIVLYKEHRRLGFLSPQTLTALKPRLIFQSDRKYIRMKDSFERCVRAFYRNNSQCAVFLTKVTKQGAIDLKKAIELVSSWIMFGRFSAFLFVEAFSNIAHLPVLNNVTINWPQGATATSGLLNLFGRDNAADEFDRTKRLAISASVLDKMMLETERRIAEAGGAVNVTEIETSLCAYRKFYKGTRYNGYYLDRMLEELYAMQSQYPDVSQELFDMRLQLFDDRYLGEKGGWRGIRKDMKKRYLTMGDAG